MSALAQSWFAPPAAAKAVVLIAPAMAVRQDYYTAYAEFLAGQGFVVATFDYRDTGFNALPSMRGAKADFDDWRDDLDHMIVACKARAPGLPLIVCGHSLGGQLMGFARRNQEVDAMLTIGCGTGYWGHNPKLRLRLLYLWFFAMPLYTRLFGYFPGGRLRKVGNLPREIALTWARWCRHPDYYVDRNGAALPTRFALPTFPLLGISFSDDTYITRPACDQLHDFYLNAQTVRRHIVPREVGASRIGHFGFFKLGAAHPLWTELAAWLAARSANR
jgi:predicted alpha/beta hydrolase